MLNAMMTGTNKRPKNHAQLEQIGLYTHGIWKPRRYSPRTLISLAVPTRPTGQPTTIHQKKSIVKFPNSYPIAYPRKCPLPRAPPRPARPNRTAGVDDRIPPGSHNTLPIRQAQDHGANPQRSSPDPQSGYPPGLQTRPGLGRGTVPVARRPAQPSC